MAVQMDSIVINGSHGEGGGALFRTALAASALTMRGVRIHSIRGAMRRTGLVSEDLAVLSAFADATDAEVEGDELGEPEVTFVARRPLRALNRKIDVAAFEKGLVPGNALVVLESLLPALARAGSYSRLVVQGETYNNGTLTYDAFERTTLAAHRRQGLYAACSLTTGGFGYGAKGEVELEVEPSVMEPISWGARGNLLNATAIVVTSGLAPDVAARGVDRVSSLAKDAGLKLEVEAIEVRSKSPGAFVTVLAQFENGMGSGGACGQRGLRMEAVAESAWRNFMDWYSTDATVDAFLADQLLLPAALAEGKSVFTTPRVTRRLTTMAWVIKQFLPIHITILGQDGYPGAVTVER